jgi:hypothetical protein
MGREQAQNRPWRVDALIRSRCLGAQEDFCELIAEHSPHKRTPRDLPSNRKRPPLPSATISAGWGRQCVREVGCTRASLDPLQQVDQGGERPGRSRIQTTTVSNFALPASAKPAYKSRAGLERKSGAN